MTSAAVTARLLRPPRTSASRLPGHSPPRARGGIDLRQIAGSGPTAIVPRDLEAYVTRRAPQPTPLRAAPRQCPPPAAEARVAPSAPRRDQGDGLRRLMRSAKMSEAKRNIPHFAYVEELDVTEHRVAPPPLNSRLPRGAPALSYLPSLALALVRVLRDFPPMQCALRRRAGVIDAHRSVTWCRTQTPDGLKVPVVHDAQALTLWIWRPRCAG